MTRGRKALHRAAVNKNRVGEVSRLLSQGVEIDAKDEHNQTPLHLAAAKNYYGESHFATIELLLKAGASVNAQDKYGQTPLQLLLGAGCSARTARLLLDFKADPNVKNCYNENVLFVAARGNSEVYQMLLDHGAEVNCVGSEGMTPLHLACIYSQEVIVKQLLKRGADVDALNTSGRTPLMYMLKCNKSYGKKVAALIKYSDINLIDTQGNNILSYCTYQESHWKIILEHIAKMQSLKLTVDFDIITKISSSKQLSDYFKMCTDELAQTKATKLHNSWVTFLDLLVSSKKKLKNYAGNKDLVDDFKKSDCKNKFSIYGVSIWKNVNKGIKMRRMFDRSAGMLSNNLPIFSPTHLVIRNTLDCLTMKDYVVFVSKV